MAGISILTVLAVLAGCTFSGWPTYSNTAYGFQLQYPPGGSIAAGATDTSVRIQLPITSGTNLAEKYLDIDVQVGAPTCESPLAAGYAPGIITPVSMTINGLPWVKENASEGAAGSLFDWTAYSTVSGKVCVILTFVLHSHNPEMFATPPPTFDYPAESGVFILIVDTFKWLGGSATTPTLGGAVRVLPNPPILISTLAPSETHTPVPSLTPTLRPSEVPTSSLIIFHPRVLPLVFNYQIQTNLRACLLKNPQVDISVVVSNPSVVHGVVLFFRLKNKTNGEETSWNAGVNMNPQGNGSYDKSLSADQIPNLSAISTGGGSAWLEYQFTATDLQGIIIGRSQVYADVSLVPCK
ncbi:MAG: hypothetical protein ABSB41_12790 [Anaerolineales bacterium]|jgi:hypothetical protein